MEAIASFPERLKRVVIQALIKYGKYECGAEPVIVKGKDGDDSFIVAFPLLHESYIVSVKRCDAGE